MKPTVGQTIWLNAINNNARSGRKIQEATVTKVGNKYFHAKISGHTREIKFDIVRMVNETNSVPEWEASETEQAIKDSWEKNDLRLEITRLNLNTAPLSLDKLRRIKAIILE